VAVCAPLNPRMNEAEFAAAFASLGISALVSGVGRTPALDIAARAVLPVFLLSEAGLAPAGAPCDFPAMPDTGRADVPAGARPALLMQTSGTTSNPKLVLLSHGNVLAAAGAIGSAFSLGRDDLCLNPMPLHHVHGLISAGISSLLATSACFCTPSFSADAFDKWYRAFSRAGSRLRRHASHVARSTPGRRRQPTRNCASCVRLRHRCRRRSSPARNPVRRAADRNGLTKLPR
jgi:acyl-CoA synthetase (AMP-forming)/AMP-acid ligase II